MKRIVSLLMILSLMITAAAGMAATDSPEEVETVRYTLNDIGLALNLPAGWCTATYDTAASCTLGGAFDMGEADIKELLSQTGASLYGTCDAFGITQMAVMSAPGVSFIDMRNQNLDMDSFMKGFLSTYNGNDVKDSGVYRTSEAAFAFVHFTSGTGSSTTDNMQFAANVKGKVYVIQFMSLYGIEINDISEELFKTVVDSVEFL